MEFNKDRVYTSLNADEVKVGSKGYFADTPNILRYRVQEGDNLLISEVKEICDANTPYRFRSTADSTYNLFYLVEEGRAKEEKKFRPYKDTTEMISQFYKHFKLIPQGYRPPLIWIRSKFNANVVKLIDSFWETKVNAGGTTYNMKELFDIFVLYTDGYPCGVEE